MRGDEGVEGMHSPMPVPETQSEEWIGKVSPGLENNIKMDRYQTLQPKVRDVPLGPTISWWFQEEADPFCFGERCVPSFIHLAPTSLALAALILPKTRIQCNAANRKARHSVVHSKLPSLHYCSSNAIPRQKITAYNTCGLANVLEKAYRILPRILPLSPQVRLDC